MVLVTHDLGVVSFMCDEVIVMQGGKMVEKLSASSLRFGKIKDPYTQELVDLSF